MSIDLGQILFIGDIAIELRGRVGIALSNLFRRYPPSLSEKILSHI